MKASHIVFGLIGLGGMVVVRLLQTPTGDIATDAFIHDTMISMKNDTIDSSTPLRLQESISEVIESMAPRMSSTSNDRIIAATKINLFKTAVSELLYPNPNKLLLYGKHDFSAGGSILPSKTRDLKKLIHGMNAMEVMSLYKERINEEYKNRNDYDIDRHRRLMQQSDHILSREIGMEIIKADRN
jgi:hypothetical protein